MHKKYRNTLFIFRRDLRVEDNTGLNAAMRDSRQVTACFVFDDRQIKDNPYKGAAAYDFMIHSLIELKNAIAERKGTLHFFKGVAHEVVGKMLHAHAFDAVYVNEDYTPFSRARDNDIARTCRQACIDFHTFSDALLTSPQQATKGKGSPYRVFTAFYNRARQIPVNLPSTESRHHYASAPLCGSIAFDTGIMTKPDAAGGRTQAMSILNRIEDFVRYADEKNIPALNGTT
ncbi:MAG: deoxyribodipyrimidine photo-lyase, partial [Chitinivibrionales bacterium]|nr:deoxyribodipyrimidine photo-lyase [Chitinivibrionales bacterium]